MAKVKKTGRPQFEITEEILKKVEQFAATGLTMDQIAHCLDIAPSTLYKYKAAVSEFAEAIKRGQAKGLAVVTNAIFEAAKAGNVTAQIWYSKNRAPEEWKDRVDHSGHIHQTHEHRAVSETDARIEEMLTGREDRGTAKARAH